MPDPTTCTVVQGGADAALDARLDAGLTDFNRGATSGVPDADEFTVAVKNADGELVGGISGWTWGTAIGIGLIWVRGRTRGRLGIPTVGSADVHLVKTLHV